MVTEAASSITAGPAIVMAGAQGVAAVDRRIDARPWENDRRCAARLRRRRRPRRRCREVRLRRARDDGRREVDDLDDLAGNAEAEAQLVRLVERCP